MIDPRANYRNAIAAIANGKGARNCKLLPRAACLAIRAGVTDGEFVADVQDVYPEASASEIVSALKSAQTYVGQTAAHGSYVPRAKPKPKPPRFASHVRNVLAGLDADKGAPDWVRELSPCLEWMGQPPEAQTAAFVRAAFRPDELLFVRRAKQGTTAVPGVNIRPAAEWVELIKRGERLPGECMTINPLTGRQGMTQDGKPSYRSHDCFADYPCALIEFDAMPLPMQYAFWRGFILSHKLAAALVSLTFSGGKSLHGLLNVGCRTKDEWDEFAFGNTQKNKAGLVGLFAADADARFRIDTEALVIDKAVRLPGIVRPDTGKVQELLYLNPAARSGNGWIAAEPPPVDFTKPPCGEAYGKGLCGVCDSSGRCPFAAADAGRGTTLKGGAQC